MNVEPVGAAAGALIEYEIPKEPEPVPPDMPAMFVPLQELEKIAHECVGRVATVSRHWAWCLAACARRRNW